MGPLGFLFLVGTAVATVYGACRVIRSKVNQLKWTRWACPRCGYQERKSDKNLRQEGTRDCPVCGAVLVNHYL